MVQTVEEFRVFYINKDGRPGFKLVPMDELKATLEKIRSAGGEVLRVARQM